jgi:hypothetical protein
MYGPYVRELDKVGYSIPTMHIADPDLLLVLLIRQSEEASSSQDVAGKVTDTVRSFSLYRNHEVRSRLDFLTTCFGAGLTDVPSEYKVLNLSDVWVVLHSMIEIVSASEDGVLRKTLVPKKIVNIVHAKAIQCGLQILELRNSILKRVGVLIDQSEVDRYITHYVGALTSDKRKHIDFLATGEQKFKPFGDLSDLVGREPEASRSLREFYRDNRQTIERHCHNPYEFFRSRGSLFV